MTQEFAPFSFDNSFVRELPECYERWQGARVPDPALVCFNLQLAESLGMDLTLAPDPRLPAFFAGMLPAQGSEPVALIYAGHQFGGFSPRLGDGRALLLGEVIDNQGQRKDIHLKGSGRTNFSRGGDGKAVLGPVLREYLMGEAMYALGIPTTRALAAMRTGENVHRDGIKPGAILVRVAASHIRVGTFEYFAARGEFEVVEQLVAYSLRRHYPQRQHDPLPAMSLLEEVSKAQAKLVAQWMGVGFIHGVMNTDNVTISGETIDYGPCAFMDRYDARTVFSSIDHQGRYAYGNQPGIARWNLARFAEALLPLLSTNEAEAQARAHGVLDAFAEDYTQAWLEVFAAKFGLVDTQDGDLDLFMDFLKLLGELNLDFTQAFRALSKSLIPGDDHGIVSLSGQDSASLESWLERWRLRLAGSSPDKVQQRLLANNPVYIPRNHLLQAALDAAESGDMMPFEQLLKLVSHPFTEQEGFQSFALPAPDDFGSFQTFCGT
ncbi:YdiU family protein [Shewanella sp.]|uniref:protein adenylyltransferase SelO n=1 Tax=Shewanella sp. TaxID=50422 RepID=UPI0035652773